MNILTSLTKKYLTLNKKRTIVTIIGIMLSCALICSVSILISSFQQFFIKTAIESYGPWHAKFESVPISEIKYIEHNSYVKTSYISNDLGYALLEGGKNLNKPFLSLLAYNKNAFKENKINLLSGHLPKNSNELIISNEIIKDGKVNYKLGDNIKLKIGKRMLNNQVITSSYYPAVDEQGKKETFVSEYDKNYTIVGIMEKPKYEPPYLPGYQVITYLDNTLLASFDSININVIAKNVSKCYDDLNKVAKGVNEKSLSFNDDLLRWYGVTSSDNTNKVLYTIGAVLILVIMIASIIVIHNSFNISVTERKKQFGMLTSIGSTSKQIRNMVLKEGFILSLIGIPLGILLSFAGIGGALAIVNYLDIFQGFYDAKLVLIITPLSIIITIVFSSLTIFLSSLIPAFKATRISPIDAIRLSSDIKIKGKKLRTSKLARKLFGIEGELGLKNMKRSKKKFRSTIISIFVSIVLFMTINGFANYSFKSAIKVYKDYNYNVVVYENVVNDKTVNLYNQVVKLKNIEDYSIVRNIIAITYFNKNDLNHLVIGDKNFTSNNGKYTIVLELSTLGDKAFHRYVKKNKLDIKEFEDINDPKAIIIKNSVYVNYSENKMYDIPLTNIKKGDHLNLYDANGDKEKVVNKIEIGSLGNVYPVGFGSENRSTGTIQGFISDKVYDSLYNNLKSDKMMFIDSRKANDTIKEIKELAKQKEIDISTINIEEQAKQLSNVVLAIDIFLYGFIILVSLITITNVINTITTSIYLRRTEFAMLKAVGMTNKEFNRMIRFENIYYGLKALLYGLPIGILIDYFLFKNVSSVFVYEYKFPLNSVLVCIISVIIIVTITTMYSIRKINKDNIIDAIKQENI